MTKPNPTAPERLTSACSDTLTHEFTILENLFFETYRDMRSLSPLQGPAEFFEQAAILAWHNAERSLKAYGQLSSEIGRFWFDALKTAPTAAPTQTKSRAA